MLLLLLLVVHRWRRQPAIHTTHTHSTHASLHVHS
jgi:hypothetical protein